MKMKESMIFINQQQSVNTLGLPDISKRSSEKNHIREIQMKRGGEPCFLSDKRYSCSEVCEWSDACKKLKAVWLR